MSPELLDDLRAAAHQALSADTGDVVDELDLAGLLVETALDGLGLGDREMVLVAIELGRTLSPSRFLPTVVLASTLLQHADTGVAAEVLAGLVAGDIACVVATADVEKPWTPPRPTALATATADGGWLLDGSLMAVSTPVEPDLVLAVAATADGAALFAVAAEHIDLTPVDQLDPARGLAEAVLSRAPAGLLATPAAAPGGIAAAYRRGLLAVGGEQLGVARASLETAVDYAKTRSQFGAPIGSFQAIKHRCAEMLLATELAEAVLDQAIGSETLVDAELAFTTATRAALFASESGVHIHGGIGFTWEHSAHRYLRRARVNATLLGPAVVHRTAIAASVDLTGVDKDGGWG